ncbi:MAG: hypothetical protein QOI15_2358, partial [Pseudonocardiales bacterium]|nr:hypothetical protein [Pseudonocardiales bacterium]
MTESGNPSGNPGEQQWAPPPRDEDEADSPTNAGGNAMFGQPTVHAPG